MPLEKIPPSLTFKETSTYVQGTVKDLVSRGIAVNKIPVDKASLGVLIHLGMGELIGEVEPSSTARGKAPKVYRIKRKQDCVFNAASLDFSFSSDLVTI